ncbi:MAG: small subunit ribosomal protein S25e [Thermoproteota archaeon]|nr:small subunit ribosomal protein S25e [Thermoproteota archaeon]
MGGAKKKSMAQAEKQQTLQSQKQEKTDKKKGSKLTDKKLGGIDFPNVKDKELMAELTKMKAITPYSVATRYNLKISIAKDLLETLETSGNIQRVAGNSALRVYKFSGSIA